MRSHHSSHPPSSFCLLTNLVLPLISVQEAWRWYTRLPRQTRLLFGLSLGIGGLIGMLLVVKLLFHLTTT